MGILEAIGNTQLVQLERLFPGGRFRLLAKLEALNPGGSSKDRPAAAILASALRSRAVGPATVIIESSSGNMGIGLAQACRYHGLRFICVVDPKASPLNLRILEAYGAEVDRVTSPHPVTGDFLQARIDRVHALRRAIPDSFWPNQYANSDNAAAHYRTTMAELAAALGGDLDFLFIATSTCGTIRGCSEYIRDHGLATRVVAVDAVGSLIFGHRAGKRLIPGLGAAMCPPLCDPSLIHEVIQMSDRDCVQGCRWLLQCEAILAGGSSGGVVAAIGKMRHRLPVGATCVAILPDRGERYLDTVYDDQWVATHLGEFEPVAGPETAERPWSPTTSS